MNTARNTIVACLAIIGLLLLAVIRYPHWLTWLWTIIVLALVGVLALLATRRSSPLLSSLPQEAMDSNTSLQPPLEHRKESITDVILPSTRQDYYFIFSATVLWLPTQTIADESVINQTALAVDAVLSRAREITKQRDPGQVSFVRHELGRALGVMREDATGRLRVMAESVQLILPDRDQLRLNKLATVRKDEDVWESERRYEQSRRAYLGGDVLKSPGSAVVWWLVKNDDQVEKTAEGIDILTRLSYAANNTKLPEPDLVSSQQPDSPQPGFPGPDVLQPSEEGQPATDHLDGLMRAMNLAADDPERVLFARRVAELVAAHGRQEVADDIIRRFDMPDAEPSWETEDDKRWG